MANNQALIAEYKEKNDTLSGLVAKYQAFADENEALKAEKLELQEEYNAKQLAVADQIKSLKTEVDELTRALKDAQTQHEQALAVITDRKDVEREKALIELERQHQAAVSEMQRNHQEQINALNTKQTEQARSLYDELAALRKQTDEMREKYEKEIAVLKNKK